MQSWCKTWPHSGSSRISGRQNLLTKPKGACKSSWSRIGSLKSFTLTVPWNLEILWRSFLETLYVDTTEIRNKWDCWESSAQSERRYLCGTVAIRSGWKMVGRFHGMLYPSAKHSRPPVWWEDSIRKTFGQPCKGPIVPFGSLVEYYPISAKDQSRLRFGKKVLPGLFLGYALYAARIWKGDIMVADIEEQETMDASEIYSKNDSMQRK